MVHDALLSGVGRFGGRSLDTASQLLGAGELLAVARMTPVNVGGIQILVVVCPDSELLLVDGKLVPWFVAVFGVLETAVKGAITAGAAGVPSLQLAFLTDASARDTGVSLKARPVAFGEVSDGLVISQVLACQHTILRLHVASRIRHRVSFAVHRVRAGLLRLHHSRLAARGRFEWTAVINVLELSAVLDGELDALTLSTAVVSFGPRRMERKGKDGVLRVAVGKKVEKGEEMFGEGHWN